MKKDIKELPDITQRMKSIIDDDFNGNVLKFCLAIGLDNSSKVNRLFNKDKRNNTYPIPSTEIICLVCRNLDKSADWLLFGKTNENVKTNNINISKSSVKGNHNITNSNDVITESSMAFDIIKIQNQQIAALINKITNG